MQAQTTNAVAQMPVSTHNAVFPFDTCYEHKADRVVKQLSRVNLRSLIVRQNGKFISADYTKLNGVKRTLTGRLGVWSFLKGGSNKVEADDRPYLTVFDIKLAQYRTLNLETVSAIRAQGVEYVVVD